MTKKKKLILRRTIFQQGKSLNTLRPNKVETEGKAALFLMMTFAYRSSCYLFCDRNLEYVKSRDKNQLKCEYLRLYNRLHLESKRGLRKMYRQVDINHCGQNRRISSKVL